MCNKEKLFERENAELPLVNDNIDQTGLKQLMQHTTYDFGQKKWKEKENL
ncbi:hypothetical protein B4129_3162 [Bacillus safensis]|nr:hypothetical protein B4129_3162 [Bacillus safensis]